MGSRHVSLLLASVAMVFGGALQSYALTPPVEQVANGGFETGDFTGWTMTNFLDGDWAINDGTFIPPGPGGALPPIGGSFDAVSFQGGAGQHRLSQTITLPIDIGLATLSWSDRIRNHATAFSDPNQEWRVVVRDTAGNLIQEVFSTNPGDPLQQIGPNDRSFDLTALAQSLEGQQIVVSFEEQDNQGFFNTTLDEASLVLQQLDADDDTVTDSVDACPATVIPEAVPTTNLGVNRFALHDGDTLFDTTAPYGTGPGKSFTVEDTAGCSCEQIIANLGLGQGHSKFGCSIGAMEEWVQVVNQ